MKWTDKYESTRVASFHVYFVCAESIIYEFTVDKKPVTVQICITNTKLITVYYKFHLNR